MTESDWHKEFRLDCDCHTPLHFIKFDWIKWSDMKGDQTLDLFFCSDRNWGFWKRVRCALKYAVLGSKRTKPGAPANFQSFGFR